LPSLPDYLGGFLLALAFTPLVGSLTVELLSKAFERLPDRLLMPWLPKLLMMLRPYSTSALPALVKEAAALFPAGLDALGQWQPPGYRPTASTADRPGASALKAAPSKPSVDPTCQSAAALLAAHPETTNALASALGLPVAWNQPVAASPNVRS